MSSNKGAASERISKSTEEETSAHHSNKTRLPAGQVVVTVVIEAKDRREEMGDAVFSGTFPFASTHRATQYD
ncbi:uncharacterized protein SPSK_10497 [Sporothrix schenckii 1099-18]|uniref:Uncharacterized protein n=1 Tax=Sporothrix schenckii 1099-18 TaxID=1397361 RepID=A0A0F2MAV3_SPOSC|nr:uncharacterized protein SPSK_10497 [Sporothrix schenckii 1099-18]KJR86214.1 hypothetical protein SPSK_10497 [Sporothrix schenckii 1099-18]